MFGIEFSYLLYEELGNYSIFSRKEYEVGLILRLNRCWN